MLLRFHRGVHRETEDRCHSAPGPTVGHLTAGRRPRLGHCREPCDPRQVNRATGDELSPVTLREITSENLRAILEHPGWLAGPALDRYGQLGKGTHRTLALTSTGLAIVGLFLMATLDEGASVLAIDGTIVLVGLGLGGMLATFGSAVIRPRSASRRSVGRGVPPAPHGCHRGGLPGHRGGRGARVRTVAFSAFGERRSDRVVPAVEAI